MSEYQYYEFQAIDRCLTDHEMCDLRTVSTRADITKIVSSTNIHGVILKVVPINGWKSILMVSFIMLTGGPIFSS